MSYDYKFQLNGHLFTVEVLPDDSMQAPWKEHDGHGVVSDWTTRPKAPHELVLDEDRASKRFYDIKETLAIAKRDCWGINAEALQALTKRLGKAPTRKQITAEAVRRDFEYLRGWCRDEWSFVGVVVTHHETGEEQSLWGIASLGNYHEEAAREVAEEILYTLEQEALKARISNRFADAMANAL